MRQIVKTMATFLYSCPNTDQASPRLDRRRSGRRWLRHLSVGDVLGVRTVRGADTIARLK